MATYDPLNLAGWLSPSRIEDTTPYWLGTWFTVTASGYTLTGAWLWNTGESPFEVGRDGTGYTNRRMLLFDDNGLGPGMPGSTMIAETVLPADMIPDGWVSGSQEGWSFHEFDTPITMVVGNYYCVARWTHGGTGGSANADYGAIGNLFPVPLVEGDFTFPTAAGKFYADADSDQVNQIPSGAFNNAYYGIRPVFSDVSGGDPPQILLLSTGKALSLGASSALLLG